MWKRQSLQTRKLASRARCGYDSALERDVAKKLRLREKAGDIAELREQHKITLTANEWDVCTIIVDFSYFQKGRFVLHEAKGYMTDTWRLKWKLLQALYPQYLYIVEFRNETYYSVPEEGHTFRETGRLKLSNSKKKMPRPPAPCRARKKQS